MKSILEFDLSELTSRVEQLGQPAYRAKQVYEWLYKHTAGSYEQMTNLPHTLQEQLAQTFSLDPLQPMVEQKSKDGQTLKTLFSLHDDTQIEAVLMRYSDRRTLCISTQAGCAMGCPFCATGQGGFFRNLTAGEITAQVLYYARQLAARNEKVTNIVFMGMGEPLANYAPTWQAIRRLNDPAGFGLGARAFTISTVGLAQGIKRMMNEPEQVNLAVSLHAPNNKLRDQLAPVNRRFPLDVLISAVREYIEAKHRRVSFEYALIAGVNDSIALADELAALLQGLLCHVNLIPLNPTTESSWRGSSQETVKAFKERLEKKHIPVSVRMRRGLDIQAGCGQLRQHVNRIQGAETGTLQ